MARNKQPLELAKLKGAHKKDPQRYRKVVPKHDKDIGAPPAHMKKKGYKFPEAIKIWQELVGQALPGVLTASDRVIMEMASNLLSEYRRDPSAFTSPRYQTLLSCLSRLGLTPSDRQRLGVNKPEGNEENEFKDF